MYLKKKKTRNFEVYGQYYPVIAYDFVTYSWLFHPMYVMNNQKKSKERKNKGKSMLCISLLCLYHYKIPSYLSYLTNCSCIITVFSLIHISAFYGVAVECKSSQESYTWWYETICLSLFLSLWSTISQSNLLKFPCPLLGVLIGFFSPWYRFSKNRWISSSRKRCRYIWSI